MVSLNRVDSFHVGQVWETSRGSLYRVIEVRRGGQAVLRLGSDGKGRIVRRPWDAVIGWYLYSDDNKEVE